MKGIKTKIAHSETKAAWNVIGTTLGGKYKIARCPYEVTGDYETDVRFREEAFQHATFICHCFNKDFFKL